MTYGEVGATLAETPDGYEAIDAALDLGSGDGAFEKAAEALRGWASHRAAGLEIFPQRPALAEGETLILVFRAFPFWVTAAGRIVWVVDEADRFGFAYGTLPHHPERGEEAFVVERDPEGRVRYGIRAFSRPVHPLSRLGGPVTRAIQAWATRRYLQGVATYVRTEAGL